MANALSASCANFFSIATDEKGVIQIFNVGAERMFGYLASEVLNKVTPADICDRPELVARAKTLSEDLAAPITPGFEALVFKAARGIEDIYELTYIRKDGSRCPVIVSVTALREVQGGIIGYLLIGTDNTARKRIEEQLRWTEESFRLMVESVTDYGIVMLDTEGRVATWNSGAQRIKGYRAEEIIGQHFSRFYSREEIDRGAPQRDQAIVTANGRLEVEGWRVRKDGSTFWANVVITAIRDQNGNLRGFAKLTRDLTERNKVEAELTTAKSVAEKANLAKSEFLSSMSHELRSPLNAILGFAQLMESASPKPTHSQKESLTQILQAGWYLLKLINEILDLAGIESGKVSLSRESVSLAEVMSECWAMMEPQFEVHDGVAEASFPPPFPTGVPRRTLLYVEDNPANLKLVEQIIERCPDLQLLAAVNGTLGIELAHASQPSVILLDINLPGINGIEVLKILRENPVTAHIPVVALSANAMPCDIKKGLAVGFFRYLTKPIIVKEFLDTLNEALAYAEQNKA